MSAYPSADAIHMSPTQNGRPLDYDTERFALMPVGPGISRSPRAALVSKEGPDGGEEVAEIGFSVLIGLLGLPHMAHHAVEAAKTARELLGEKEPDGGVNLDLNLNPSLRLNPAFAYRLAARREEKASSFTASASVTEERRRSQAAGR